MLRGTVRDAQGKAVAAATVQLRAKDAAHPLTTHTDSQGNYSFAGLQQGVYEVHAEMTGYGVAEVAALFFGPKEVKTVDFTLLPAKTSASRSPSAPAFFDQPQFTVAGVTDTTNLGGHGSDVVVRARETIAKEAATLGKAPAGPQPAASADTEKLCANPTMPSSITRSATSRISWASLSKPCASTNGPRSWTRPRPIFSIGGRNFYCIMRRSRRSKSSAKGIACTRIRYAC